MLKSFPCTKWQRINPSAPTRWGWKGRCGHCITNPNHALSHGKSLKITRHLLLLWFPPKKWSHLILRNMHSLYTGMAFKRPPRSYTEIPSSNRHHRHSVTCKGFNGVRGGVKAGVGLDKKTVVTFVGYPPLAGWRSSETWVNKVV